MNPNSPFKVVLHNNIYRCFICEKVKVIPRHPDQNKPEDHVYFVLETFGMNPHPKTQLLDAAATPKPVCWECFTSYDLTLDAPQIIVPQMQVPKDLKKN